MLTATDLSLDYPPVTRGRVVVWGLLAAAPFGGMTWQVLHHLAGLRLLGFDVWYVEDSDRMVLDPETRERTASVDRNITYLKRHLELIGLGNRWAFRTPRSRHQMYGALTREGLQELYRDADCVVNVCGAHELRDEHLACGCLIYMETDPVANQVAVARNDPRVVAALDPYHFHFTYGTNLGADDCPVPIERYRWRPTRPPAVISWWRSDTDPKPDTAVTTIANWNNSGTDVEWNGVAWRWSKRDAFRRFIRAPGYFDRPLEIAVVGAGGDVELLKDNGWRTVSAWDLADPGAYRSFIQGSAAEFSVAKDQYVLPRSGWFSDRSVCYLAANRPVVVQDTGFADRHGISAGILPFNDERELSEAARSLGSDYLRHTKAAEELAHEHFEASVVLGDVMREVGLL